MEDLQKKFFDIMCSFQKLHFYRILPGINMSDLAILKTLKQLESQQKEGERGVLVSAIVGEMHVPAPAVSRNLKNLEEKDYLIRYVHKKDRRNTCVEMTREGEAILETSNQAISEFNQSVFREMGEKDMERLLAYFMKLYRVTEAEIANREYDKKRKDSVKREEDI